VPGASKDARYDHDGIGCALSSHSTMTRGQALKRLTLAEALKRGDLEAFVGLFLVMPSYRIALNVGQGDKRE
jgi:hypothetical protein